MEKLQKDIWFYYMGMMDGYDYITGLRKAFECDKFNIEEWADDIRNFVYYL